MTQETSRDIRKKLRRAEKSRGSWRNKHKEKQYEIKKLKAKLTAVRENRDEWRCRIQDLEAKVEKLESIKQKHSNLVLELDTTKASPQKKIRNRNRFK